MTTPAPRPSRHLHHIAAGMLMAASGPRSAQACWELGADTGSWANAATPSPAVMALLVAAAAEGDLPTAAAEVVACHCPEPALLEAVAATEIRPAVLLALLGNPHAGLETGLRAAARIPAVVSAARPALGRMLATHARRHGDAAVLDALLGSAVPPLERVRAAFSLAGVRRDARLVARLFDPVLWVPTANPAPWCAPDARRSGTGGALRLVDELAAAGPGPTELSRDVISAIVHDGPWPLVEALYTTGRADRDDHFHRAPVATAPELLVVAYSRWAAGASRPARDEPMPPWLAHAIAEADRAFDADVYRTVVTETGGATLATLARNPHVPVCVLAERHVTEIPYWADAAAGSVAARCLAERVGDDPIAFGFAAELLVTFDGTFAELCDVVAAAVA